MPALVLGHVVVVLRISTDPTEFLSVLAPFLLEALEAILINSKNKGQISKPNEYTDNFKSNLSCIFLSFCQGQIRKKKHVVLKNSHIKRRQTLVF